MKNKSLLILGLPLAIMACNNDTTSDSVEKADSANEAKMDTASNAGTIKVDESTADFMVKTADVGMTEVKLGQLAQNKATSQRVKDFAAMMVKDHSAGNDDLKSLASQKNVTLPSAIGDDHQKKMDDLAKKTGKDFDRAYMDMMVDGHQSAVNSFEKNKDNKDAEVNAFVNKVLPILRMHLDSAKAVKSSLK
jgi:putative membrane protein